jgi:ferrochelatase
MRNSGHDAVLLIGFGGPEKRADILPFLERLARGRSIPKERLADVAHHYEAIGGASPINEITRRQASALERELRAQGSELIIYVGQRNWHPFLEDALRRMAEDGVSRAIGFPAAAHRCEASWERYLNAVEEVRKKVGAAAPVVDYVGPWFDHPLFIEAITERIKEAGAPRNASWIFMAHSIPKPMAASSRYVQELERTAELAAERLGQTQWRLAYSSRSGRPQDPWIEPDVSEAIVDEARRGVREVLLIPIGFIADHVEVLYDLDVEAKKTADKASVRLWRAQTVGDHPLFVRVMAEVVSKRMAAPSPSPHVGEGAGWGVESQ